MELLDIRNEDGSLTGQVMEREEVHSSGALHGTSHVWLIREKEGGNCDVLLQKGQKIKMLIPAVSIFLLPVIYRRARTIWNLQFENCMRNLGSEQEEIN